MMFIGSNKLLELSNSFTLSTHKVHIYIISIVVDKQNHKYHVRVKRRQGTTYI